MMKHSDIDKNSFYLKQLLLLSSDIIIFLSQDGMITEFNPLAEKYFLWEKNVILGKKFESLYTDEKIYTPFPHKIYQSILSKKNFSFEHTSHYAKNKLAISWTTNRLASDGISALGYIFLGKNITDLNKTNSQNARIQNQLERISSCVPGNFYWKNTEAEYVGCNQTLFNTLGLKSMHDLVGKTDYDLWPQQADDLKKMMRLS